jgi:hypothetical protein
VELRRDELRPRLAAHEPVDKVEAAHRLDHVGPHPSRSFVDLSDVLPSINVATMAMNHDGGVIGF